MIDRSEPPLTPTEVEIVKQGGYIVRCPAGDLRDKIKAILETVTALTDGNMPTDEEIDEAMNRFDDK